MPSLETANVGKAVAARVGTNIREVRTKLGMTQAQLAAPDFSISYISAIERGKIRPSLKALSILARRLDVPLTYLLEGNPTGAAEARAVGYSPADSEPDQRVDVDLLQAAVLVQQGTYEQAAQILAPIQPERITIEQAYRLFLLRGKIHLGERAYQEAIVDLRAAASQAEGMQDDEALARAANLLGAAYFQLYQYTLARECQLRAHALIEQGALTDPQFALAVLSDLGRTSSRLGDNAQAVHFFQRALDLTEELKGDTASYAQQYMQSSQRYKKAGKLGLARDYAMRSLAVYELHGEQGMIALMHLQLGKVLEKQKKFDEAELEYQQALDLARQENDEVTASRCYTALAELFLKRDDVKGAKEAAQEAFALAEKSNDTRTMGEAGVVMATALFKASDYPASDEIFSKAVDLLGQSGAFEAAANAYFHYANQLETRGEMQRSLDAIKKAYAYQETAQRQRSGRGGEATLTPSAA